MPDRPKVARRRRAERRYRNAHPFARPRPGWISSNHEYRRAVRSQAHGFPRGPRRDESLRSGEIRVGAIDGNRLPRPFGPTSGSRAAGKSGLHPMLYAFHARGASADILLKARGLALRNMGGPCAP